MKRISRRFKQKTQISKETNPRLQRSSAVNLVLLLFESVEHFRWFKISFTGNFLKSDLP